MSLPIVGTNSTDLKSSIDDLLKILLPPVPIEPVLPFVLIDPVVPPHPPGHVDPVDPPALMVPGITVQSVSGNGITTEFGGASVYSFVVNCAPTDDVTLTFTLSDLTEARMSSATLSFSAANWNIPQFLTVTGLDDYDSDGDIAYSIRTRVTSADPDYGGLRDLILANLQLINQDDGLDDDPIFIPDGNDDIQGGDGKDRLFGLLGRDRLRGGRNDDRLYGGYDDDSLWGEDDNDLLFGEEDDDSLYGGNGDDRLTGGEGSDFLVGGNGNDTYVLDDSFDTIDDQGALTDTDSVIVRSNLTAYVLPSDIEDATLEGSGATSLTGNQSDNNLTGNSNGNVLNGGAGNDTMIAADGNDTVNGGDGNDLIIGGDARGADLYVGGNGIDTVDYSSVSTNGVTVNLATGRASATSIGIDTIQSIENVIGGSRNDVITGSGLKNTLIGGVGADQLAGGAGADVFSYSAIAHSKVATSGRDTIKDFSAGAGDRIDLASIDANGQLNGDQPFNFIGSATFSGVRGQLRFASGVLSADLNGDRTPDFAIALSNVTALNVGALVL
jgi:Ca2+-binding RTX toxin-like protein